MNPVPFLWLAAVVGFLLLEASTFSMTSVWFAVGAAAALLTCLFTGSFRVFFGGTSPIVLAIRPSPFRPQNSGNPQRLTVGK